MAYRKIADIIASEHEKLHHRSVCLNCEWINKSRVREYPNDSELWFCNHPDNLVRNYVNGEIQFEKIYCSHKNKDGKCMNFERIIPDPPEQKEEKSLVQSNYITSFWERMKIMVKRWFTFDTSKKS